MRKDWWDLSHPYCPQNGRPRWTSVGFLGYPSFFASFNAFTRLIGILQSPLDQALRSFVRFIDILLEQVVENDLAVNKVDGVFIGCKAIGSNHHGLDENSFLDGVTQYFHFVSD